MLVHLIIKNYALIRHLEIKPSAHLNVITGETGAGKSIMLGAISLLLGNRADTRVLWDDTDKCIIEGSFDLSSYPIKELFDSADLDYHHLTVIRREINTTGKSRAFINDTPVTLDVMKKIGTVLMDVHSQHETLELGNKIFQLNLIDTFAGNKKLREEYSDSWRAFVQSKEEYESLLKEAQVLKQEAEFVKFQLNELVKADLKEDEQEKMESHLKVMEHAEDIKIRLNQILRIFSGSEYSIEATLAEVRSLLHPIVSFSAAYEQLFQRVESSRIELEDILTEIEKEEQGIEFDARQTEETKERLSLIYQLLQKHRINNVAGLLTLQESLQIKAGKTTNVDNLVEAAKSALEQNSTTLQARATALSKSREKVFDPLCHHIMALLRDLGIPEVRLKIEKETATPGVTGSDSIEVLFSANKGIPMKPLDQVASGGEFSRLMFCVKYVMAEKRSLPTLILDEIDNGVSGEIAIQLGTMMKKMAERHQIITITHLPQIAAKGDTHYFVYKDNTSTKTTTHIRQLDEKERVGEIAKMIGGAKPSTLAMENARELMNSSTSKIQNPR